MTITISGMILIRLDRLLELMHFGRHRLGRIVGTLTWSDLTKTPATLNYAPSSESEILISKDPRCKTTGI